MATQLPQDDPNPKAREEQLAEARQTYQFDYEYFGLGFLAGELPKADKYSDRASMTLAAKTAEFWANHAAAALVEAGEDVAAKVEKGIGELRTRAEAAISELRHRPTHHEEPEKLAHESKTAEAASKSAGGPSVEAYRNMFHLIKIPPSASHWDEDWYFAYQTVTSIVPDRLRRLDTVPENFPVTDEMYQRATGDQAGLAAALREKRVFLLDFTGYAGVPGSPGFGAEKVTLAPMAMFAWVDTTEHGGFGLRPVAIQCGPQPGDATPVFLPTDGWLWKMARMIVQAAIGTYSGTCAHLGVHMVMERCVISTYRTLAQTHPIYALLRLHYQFTLAVNVYTKVFSEAPTHNPVRILEEGKFFQSFLVELLSPPRDINLDIMRKYVDGFRLDTATPPSLFAENGLDDPNVLPMYPFRDDTTRVFAAIQEFVAAYVALYYREDASVIADHEVQAWVRELQAEQGGRLQGVGVGGKVETVQALTDLVAQIIYLASAYHAALNYSGYENLSFPLCISYAGFNQPPTRSTPNTEEELKSRLPPMDFAWMQFHFAWVQYMLWENWLGSYPEGYFDDPRATELGDKLYARLKGVALAIKEDNKRRPLPYLWQIPFEAVTASLHN